MRKENTKIDFKLDAFPNKLLARWANNNKIVIADNNAKLYKFINDRLSNSDYKAKLYFGRISKDLANYIEEKCGYDFFEKNLTLRADTVRKIFKSHGNDAVEKARGQRAITMADFLLIPDIILDSDNIIKDEYHGHEACNFVKEICGSRITVFAVSSGKRTLDLFVQTMYSSK